VVKTSALCFANCSMLIRPILLFVLLKLAYTCLKISFQNSKVGSVLLSTNACIFHCFTYHRVWHRDDLCKRFCFLPAVNITCREHRYLQAMSCSRFRQSFIDKVFYFSQWDCRTVWT